MTNGKWFNTLNPMTRAALLILLLSGLALIQQSVSFGRANRLEIALNNAAHVPWFFLITCLLWHITALFSQMHWRRHLLWVAVLALALAIGLEAVQLFTRRDADLADVGLNLLGACSALLAIRATHLWRLGQVGRASVIALLVTILSTASFIRAAEVLWIYSKRNAISPELITFSQPDFPARALMRGRWELADSPIKPRDNDTSPVARVTLRSQLQWPGVTLMEPIPDWNRYRTLVLHAYTAANRSLPLEVRLETNSDRGMDSTVSIELSQETEPIRIPLSELGGSRFGRLDDVRNLYLYSARLDSDAQFFIESISLE